MAKKQAMFLGVAGLFFGFLASVFLFQGVVVGATYEPGDVITSEGTALYYLGFDERLHPFPSAAVYHSWFSDFDRVNYVGKGVLTEYQIGASVCIRPGTWLVQFRGFSSVYAVEPGCHLRQLRSEVEAFVLFGEQWQRRVIHLDAVERGFYRIDGFDDARSARDSDADRVSDYEEEVYWLTDPNDADSDNDGRADGEEILSGSSPSGGDLIGTLSAGMYTFPAGAVLPSNRANQFYYQSTTGQMLDMDRRTYEGAGRYSGYHRAFLTRPAFEFFLSERSRGSITSREDRLYYPTVDRGGDIIPL